MNVVVPPGCTGDVVGFYELLGMVRVPKPGDAPGAWFDLGDGTQLHVSERPGPVHPDAHFAVVVPDLAAVVASLRASGRPWVDAAPQSGARRGHTADPAGNAVELVELVEQVGEVQP